MSDASTPTAADLVAEARQQIQFVSVTDAFDELTQGAAVFLDIREPVEWEQHIDGALQIPRGLLEFVADPECGPRLPDSLRIGLEPDQRVVVYCNTGGRGALAALTLKTLGYERVANLEGGLTSWRQAGLPVAEHHGAI